VGRLLSETAEDLLRLNAEDPSMDSEVSIAQSGGRERLELDSDVDEGVRWGSG